MNVLARVISTCIPLMAVLGIPKPNELSPW